jgi:hypothetical protein
MLRGETRTLDRAGLLKQDPHNLPQDPRIAGGAAWYATHWVPGRASCLDVAIRAAAQFTSLRPHAGDSA